MRLLLDEMIPPQIARGLRDAGYDVEAIKWDRDDLLSMSDLELVRVMVGEERAIVTNDAEDFELIHEQVLAAGMEHHGLVLTSDATMPRTRQAISQWIEALGVLLDEHRAADALRNQIHHLP